MPTCQLEGVITQFLSSHDVNPCLLLVSPSIEYLTAVTRELERQYAWPRISLGKSLSATLLNVLPPLRSRQAERWLQDRLRDHASGPVLCTEIDLLFEPTLNLDPLMLFRRGGRVTPLVITWPGTYKDNVLAYAVPEHSHFRTWCNPDAQIVPLRGPLSARSVSHEVS